ncbi:uncharacterized protein [Eucyclogobius newberryi]|uniref:uncharacterized protein n=1 Tax=Eucyclogobius newberryi TaxID=166745 RepID=UPI003B5CBA7D
MHYREKVKATFKNKYRIDSQYQCKLKAASINKYKANLQFQNKLKAASINKYKANVQHKQNVKAASKQKYKTNPLHKQKVKALVEQKYRHNEQFKNKTREAYTKSKKQLKQKLENFTFVMEQFIKEVEDGPEYVCCVCLKLLFKNQVLPCKKEDFMAKPKCAAIADACISEAYLHTCDKKCPTPCPLLDCRGSLWICYTCNSKLCKGEMPAESSVNNLQLDDIPPELACLNTVEQHIVALNINFMQVLALPKGGQRGAHGPSTCVPSRITETVKLLPRSNMDGCLLPVKLKRKLSYKGHYEYQYVDTERVRRAIEFLKRNNQYYIDIDFNEEWVNEFEREEHEAMDTGVNVNVAAEDTGVDVNVTAMDTGVDVNVTAMDTGADVNVTAMDTGADVNVTAMDTGADVNVAAEDTGVDVNVTAMDTGVDVNVTAMDTGVDVNVTAMDTGADVNVAAMGTRADMDLMANQVEQEQAELDDELLHNRQRHCMYQDTFFMPADIGQEALDHYFEGVLNLAPAEGNSPICRKF